MLRILKWATPVVALTLLLSFNSAARAEETKSPAGAGGVTGTVLDGEGKPASGVLVRLFKPFERGPGRPAAASKAEKQAADAAARDAR